MIQKYSIKLFKPHWPNWAIWVGDMILNHLPFLSVRKANAVLDRVSHLKGGLFLHQLAVYLKIRTHATGVEHLPKEGSAIIVSNHPGKGDVIALLRTLIVKHKRQDVVALANRLVAVRGMAEHVIPVNTLAPRGKKVPYELVEQAVQEGKMVVFFPYGKNSRYTPEGELQDLVWRPSFLKLAMKFNVPVIIVNISGTQNSALFYRVAKIRERIGWLRNVPLENFFQLREFVTAEADVQVTFTRPVSPTFLHTHVKTSADEQRMAELMRRFCYRIDSPTTSFEDSYGI